MLREISWLNLHLAVLVRTEFFGVLVLGITKFAPDGTPLAQVQTGGLISPVDVVGISRFALDRVSGLILDLSPSGQINLIDPNQLTITPFLNLRSVPIQTDQVFDTAVGGARDLTGALVPSLASYGDIAIFNSDVFTDLYISGIGPGQAFPFILRLRFSETLGNSAQVILSSSATAAPNEGTPPGIAVNSQGLVLTTLGVNTGSTLGNFSAPVAFLVDFNPVNPTNETIAVFSNFDLSSRGMTTDAAGNFYVATGSIGSNAAGVNGGGAILAFSPALQITGIFTQGVAAASQDVAVSPDGQFLYATLGGSAFSSNGVIGFQLTPAIAALQFEDLTIDLG